MHPAVESLRKLPIAEKLRVIGELWDDITESEEAFPLPEWAVAEANRRAAELDADPSLGLTREELWERVRNRNG
jgi:putative addiction module component (TIGR02574 family)